MTLFGAEFSSFLLLVVFSSKQELLELHLVQPVFRKTQKNSWGEWAWAVSVKFKAPWVSEPAHAHSRSFEPHSRDFRQFSVSVSENEQPLTKFASLRTFSQSCEFALRIWSPDISVLKNSESARERARARRTFQNFQLRERAASSSSKFRGEWASNESARRSLARGSLAIFLPNPKMPHFGQKRVAEGGCWVDLSKGDHE